MALSLSLSDYAARGVVLINDQPTRQMSRRRIEPAGTLREMDSRGELMSMSLFFDALPFLFLNSWTTLFGGNWREKDVIVVSHVRQSLLSPSPVGQLSHGQKVSYDYYGRFLSTGTSIRTVDRYTYHRTTNKKLPSTNLWGGWVVCRGWDVL